MTTNFFAQPATTASLPVFPSSGSGGSSAGVTFQLTPSNTNNVAFSGLAQASSAVPAPPTSSAPAPFSFGPQAAAAAAPATGNAASGGLFAPKPAVTSAPITSNLFGATPSSAPAASASSWFGATPAPAAASSSFSGTPTAPAHGSSLFGTASNNTSTAPSTNFFSGATQQSSFGQSQPFSISQLGSSQPAQQSQQHGQQQQQDRRLGPSLSARMIAVHQAWDVNNLQTCRFLHYFYSALPPELRSLMGPTGAGGGGGAAQYPNLGRRPDAIGPRHDALWAQATRENPEPGRLVAVLAVGFSDLKVRAESQAAEAERQRKRLADIQARLSTLEQAHSLRNATRAAAAQRRQVALDHRLLANARRAHLLIPALRGSSVSAEEEALRAKLERCEAELEAVGSGVGQGRVRARVNELWALLGALKAKREHNRREGVNSAEWAVVDERVLDNVAMILSGQQQGMNHLITTIESDAKALDTVVKGLEGVQLVGVKGAR